MATYATYFEGDRVMDTKSGRKGTVAADYDGHWQTAGVEFDDEKGVVIQILKSDLLYYDVESRVNYIHEKGHGDVELTSWDVKLANVDVHRMSTGMISMELYNRSCDRVAEVMASASEMQAFALRILQQTTYVLEDKER